MQAPIAATRKPGLTAVSPGLHFWVSVRGFRGREAKAQPHLQLMRLAGFAATAVRNPMRIGTRISHDAQTARILLCRHIRVAQTRR
jgi:hypothetical protein